MALMLHLCATKNPPLIYVSQMKQTKNLRRLKRNIFNGTSVLATSAQTTFNFFYISHLHAESEPLLMYQEDTLLSNAFFAGLVECSEVSASGGYLAFQCILCWSC